MPISIKASNGEIYDFPDEADSKKIGSYLKSKGLTAKEIVEPGFAQPKAAAKKAEPWVDPNGPMGGPAAMMGGMGVTPQMAMGGAKDLEKTALYKGGEALGKVGEKVAKNVTERPMTSAGMVIGSAVGGPPGTAAGTYLGSIADQIYGDPYNQKKGAFGKVKSAAGEAVVTGLIDRYLPVVFGAGKSAFNAVFGTGARRVEQVAAGESLALVEAGGKSLKDWFAAKQAARVASYKSAESEMARSQADALGLKLTPLEKVGTPPTRVEIATKKIMGGLKDAAELLSTIPETAKAQAGGMKKALDEAKQSFHKQFTEDYRVLDNMIEEKAPKMTTVRTDVVDSKFGKFSVPRDTTTGSIGGGNISKNFKAASEASRQVEMRGVAPKLYEPKPFEKAITADLDQAPSMTFEKAHQLRSDLLAKARAWEGGVNAKENLEVANRAIKAIDEEMSRAAKSAGEDVYRSWRALNSAYGDGKALFESDLITGMAAAKPEDLVASIAPGKMGMTDAQSIMKALSYNVETAPQSIKAFQRAYAENVIKSGDPMKMKERLADIGGETLGTIFGHSKESAAFLGSLQASAQLMEQIAKNQAAKGALRHALHGGTTTVGAIATKFGHIALDKYNEVLAAATVKIMENEGAKKEYFKALRTLADGKDMPSIGAAGNALEAIYKNAIAGKNEKKKP